MHGKWGSPGEDEASLANVWPSQKFVGVQRVSEALRGSCGGERGRMGEMSSFGTKGMRERKDLSNVIRSGW